ncbi:MAG: heterodisulfide reductase subunit C [Planctomycetes bacterium B3_Pla]|nr:MAG: heterodisulfide reductase subunit C [Planctomycetes bacterium B3_Pla]
MKVINKKEIKVDSSFAEEVAERSGENVFLCYQCRKCASGCPSRIFMDSTPTELMRYVQLGMVDEAMKGNTAWFCVSCQTCSTRCPQDIDIAHVVDTIRIIVQEKKIKADTRNMRLFNWIWMKTIKYMGRMYEAGLVGSLNLFTGKPFKDMALGARMIKKGKIKLIPPIRNPLETMKMFSRAKRLKK